MSKTIKKRALRVPYVSLNASYLEGFETPFQQKLTTENRWVKMAHLIPWDDIVNEYHQLFKTKEGGQPINGRIVIGAIIIKHILNLTDRETIAHIQENMFMQYFIGYSTFTNEAPFTSPVFVDIRKRLSADFLNRITQIIVKHCSVFEEEKDNTEDDNKHNHSNISSTNSSNEVSSNKPIDANKNLETKVDYANKQDIIDIKSIENLETQIQHKSIKTHGKLLVDATVAPQNITFPTDLKLLNAARKKAEELIDKLYDKNLHGQLKPRTYREEARKLFLNIAKKRCKTSRQIYLANGRQLRFLKRNIKHIENLLQGYKDINKALQSRDKTYFEVIKTVYLQQYEMHSTHKRTVENRIVNIHQSYVRPIVRGKEKAKVEFGSKLSCSVVNGFFYLDKLSWSAYNEGNYLKHQVLQYVQRFLCLPEYVYADQIYCTRENRRWLKILGVKLKAKALGRPSNNAEAVADHVSPGERNPIEAKFGEAKIKYGLNLIKAKLQNTSESWIATIALVLNLTKLVREAPFYLIQIIIKKFFFNYFKRYVFVVG